tara:strand:- start:530 stop:2251 length:1722 start_codon:yes stop_codon:yes gene_type:complete
MNSLNTSEHRQILIKEINSNPNNNIAKVMLASLEFGNNSESAFKLLDTAFSSTISPIDLTTDYRFVFFLSLLTRYKIENLEYDDAITYLHRIINTNHIFPTVAQEIQLATLVTCCPKNIEDAKSNLINIEKRIDKLLSLDSIDISYVQDPDPYLFCMLSFFNIEIYHECDIKTLMHKYYKLSIKAFPDLVYISPRLDYRLKIDKPTIGIVSAFFTKDSSVVLDFKGIIENFLEKKFKIEYIDINERKNNNSYLHNKKNVRSVFKTNNWLNETRSYIENLQLDILFYLDSTMSGMIQQLMASKLAKIQILSHGHPITSGVDSCIMNYFISWAGAELEYNEAQKHYTEKLLLVPEATIHQFYAPISRNNISLRNNESFQDITRIDFRQYVPSDGNWYLCMQKPFKRHPEFDLMLKGILDADKNARILLHDDSKFNEMFLDRFRNIDADISRIYFIPCQPHHRLMGLYNMSDVILDSYYAGGCTTTREAFEVGGIVVTLPTNYLGGRWTYGYYNIIGIKDMIAKTKKEYIDISVKLGTNKQYNKEMKTNILKNVNKLFYQQTAIDAWDKIFCEILN